MLGLGLGLFYGRLPQKTSNVLISRYIERVDLDGGTVEAMNCLGSANFNSTNWSYYFRVLDDGGIIESLECVTL